VDVIFTAVAIPKGANVLEPVVPTPASKRVSVLIAIVIVAPEPVMKTTLVPIGNGKLVFDGIVTVLVAEAYMCSPESDAIIV
jgi:hypothetical protein